MQVVREWIQESSHLRVFKIGSKDSSLQLLPFFNLLGLCMFSNASEVVFGQVSGHIECQCQVGPLGRTQGGQMFVRVVWCFLVGFLEQVVGLGLKSLEVVVGFRVFGFL